MSDETASVTRYMYIGAVRVCHDELPFDSRANIIVHASLQLFLTAVTLMKSM